jgi:hypothetical protein
MSIRNCPACVPAAEIVVPESAGRNRNRNKEEKLQVILPSAPLALGVADGNVTDDDNVHHKSLGIKDYFLDRHKHSAVAAEHQWHFPIGMIP